MKTLPRSFIITYLSPQDSVWHGPELESTLIICSLNKWFIWGQIFGAFCEVSHYWQFLYKGIPFIKQIEVNKHL